jgi:hypothetical protein
MSELMVPVGEPGFAAAKVGVDPEWDNRVEILGEDVVRCS